MKKIKQQARLAGPKTLTQFRRMKENDYASKPWRYPVFSYGINLNIAEVEQNAPPRGGAPPHSAPSAGAPARPPSPHARQCKGARQRWRQSRMA